jgi:D-glycero-beta-D-manno-heptose 1-phosphate adenylyltransferase
MNHLHLVQNKIIAPEKMPHLLAVWHFKDEKTVFTNGCFDILHKGHIHLLAAAADLGKHLIVGVNSDASVRRIKKAGRPLQNQESRALVIAALDFVDMVVIFEEDTPLEIIKQIKPGVLVKGGDYKLETIVGSDFVLGYGGKVEIVPLLPGYSTTAIEEKIKTFK